MKKFLPLLAFSLLAFAIDAQPCDLIQKTVSMDGRSDTTTYERDGETHAITAILRPQEPGEYTREIYHYGEGRLNSMEAGNFSFLYFHDEKDRIFGFIDYDDLGVSNSFHEFTYDNKGRVIQFTSYETPFLEDTVVSEIRKYYYEGDKMVKMEEYLDRPTPDSPPSSTTVYEYTSKPNPEYNPQYFPNLAFKYVVSKQTYSDADGVYDDFSFTRECTYNKQGYPVKCTLKYLDGSDKGVETYAYRCKK